MKRMKCNKMVKSVGLNYIPYKYFAKHVASLYSTRPFFWLTFYYSGWKDSPDFPSITEDSLIDSDKYVIQFSLISYGSFFKSFS